MDTVYQNHREKFDKLLSLLVEWNVYTNLTAITEPKDIITKHFLDSLTVLSYIPDTAKNLIDVGSGAGFPGMPLAIARPDLSVTLLESIGKKVAFLEACKEQLSISNVDVIEGRAEEVGQDSTFREQFDVATARAVAHLSTLVEYTLPFLKVGGIFIAQKKSGDEEIVAASEALTTLGGELVSKTNIDETKQIIIIKKVAPTPSEYPRRTGVPLKKPI